MIMMNNRERQRIRNEILAAVRQDPRVMGLVDYGSTSEGRSDIWSDIDFAVFICDEEFDAFQAGWKNWASQFGSLLLAFSSGGGHLWVAYDAPNIPIRCDFALHLASAAEQMLTWPNSPVSAESMVLYDDMEGQLLALARQLVGQSLAPLDLHDRFDNVCGGFWYYLLRTLGRMYRGERWDARFGFDFMMTGNLLALLRIEVGATERWRNAEASSGIERVLSAHRLDQLNACILGHSEDSIYKAIAAAATLGFEVSASVAKTHGWPWPEELAKRCQELVQEIQKT